jgi:hypothetical protein
VRTATGVCCELPGKNEPVKPYSLFLKQLYVVSFVRWRTWGGDVVRGKGLLAHNTCRPTCNAGNFVHRRATVMLGRRRVGFCGDRKVAFYTTLRGRWRVPRTRHVKTIIRSLEPACATL